MSTKERKAIIALEDGRIFEGTGVMGRNVRPNNENPIAPSPAVPLRSGRKYGRRDAAQRQRERAEVRVDMVFPLPFIPSHEGRGEDTFYK